MKSLFISLFIICSLLCFFPTSAEEQLVLQGSVNRVIPTGTPVKLKILSVPMNQSGFYMENWDWEGNFIPPKLNDPIVSQLAEAIYVGNDLVLPKGTLFYGKVSKVLPPKRFGKDGRLEISFEGFKTPAGKSLQFKEAAVSLTGKELSKGQNIARGAVRATSYAVGGAAAGALASTQVAGLILTSMNPQYIIGTGAGIGLLVGIVASVIKKGKPGSLMPGDEIAINIEQNLMLPVAEKLEAPPVEGFAIEGLTVKVLSKKLIRDELGIYVFLLDLEIWNNTTAMLSGSDFVAIGPHNRQFLPGGLSLALTEGKNESFNNLMSQRIGPGAKVKGQIAFEIEMPGFEHTLILKEHFTQKMLYKEPLGVPNDYFQEKKLFKIKKKLFGEKSDPWN